jgi:hypothetical protein
MELHRSKTRKPMSALGQKRTLRLASPMSALPPKADIAALLNHLVGGNEQVGRYIKAKCLGSLEIDSRLEPRRSLNR